MKNQKTPGQIADIVERFLNGSSCYPQEWNDLVDCGLSDPILEAFRRRCEQLDPLVNSPAPQDFDAIAELRAIIKELRQIEVQTKPAGFPDRCFPYESALR